ncbi:MAG: hypothetical protein ABS35_25690 [Kaistia sp. SCN 65-12]|nr:MAG: hypothetical protein ABS35_25690 [Kaistia sp. SCN 65-12]
MEGGHVVDRRGTVDYPAIEVYRAALLDALANMGLDHVALGVVMDAGAERQFQANFAPSQIADGVAKPLGSFEDAVRGIAAGENWRLIVATFPPMAVEIDGFHCGKGLHARFEWSGDAIAMPIERFDGAKPRALLTVNLASLWRPLVEILDAS